MWKIKARDGKITVQINREQKLTPSDVLRLVDQLTFMVDTAEAGDRGEIKHYEPACWNCGEPNKD